MKPNIFIIYFIIATNILIIQSMKVCNNFEDYYNPFTPNCYENPDDDSNVTNIIGRWGYNVEEYEVITDDGYKLTIFRTNSDSKSNTPVLLAHGIFMNCLCFINRGNKSLAYTYLKNGYDVWLLNFRGTRFSRGHVNLTTEDHQYWNFSFHELALKDLSTTLHLISNKTHQKAIYVGFSLGTIVNYVYSSANPGEAEKLLAGTISLAPIVYFNNIKSLLRTFHPDRFLLRSFVNTVWRGEAIPRSTQLINLCALYPFMMRFCASMMAMSLGDDFAQMDPTTFPISITQNTDATSFKLVDHYSQIMRSSIFQRYDYSSLGNRIRYGQNTPPKYDLRKITVPMTMFIGPNDWIATPHNAEKIYKQLSPSVQCGFHLVKYAKFSHVDFLFAKDIVEILYDDLLKATLNLKNGLCEKDD